MNITEPFFGKAINLPENFKDCVMSIKCKLQYFSPFQNQIENG
jgi:hypothetical protein